jgi:hypothetical protein
MQTLDYATALGPVRIPPPVPLGFITPGPLDLLIGAFCLGFVGLVVLVVLLLVLRPKPGVPPNPNLYPCPDCGRPLSRSASTCPGCGRPVGPSANQ